MTIKLEQTSETIELIKGRTALKAQYNIFDYPPESYYRKPSQATLEGYKCRNVVDGNGQPWIVVESCGIIHRNQPAPSAPEDLTQKLIYTLPARLQKMQASTVKKVVVNENFLPYDLQFIGNDMGIFSRFSPQFKKIKFGEY